MKDKRFWFGVIVSVVWVGVAVYVLFDAKPPDKLNEWGDFIAGFSAPLAFFWLVLGYMQQGDELRNNTEMLRLQAEELKHSTDALRLQAAELKNSVEQQSQLVAASREQIALETASLADERARRREAALPKFVVKRGVASTGRNGKNYGLTVSNVGRTATEVSIEFSPGTNAVGRHFAAFDGSTDFGVTLTHATDSDVELSITYIDSDEIPGKIVFPLRVTASQLDIGRGKRVVDELS